LDPLSVASQPSLNASLTTRSPSLPAAIVTVRSFVPHLLMVNARGDSVGAPIVGELPSKSWSIVAREFPLEVSRSVAPAVSASWLLLQVKRLKGVPSMSAPAVVATEYEIDVEPIATFGPASQVATYGVERSTGPG
jgi:hypothetical protein